MRELLAREISLVFMALLTIGPQSRTVTTSLRTKVTGKAFLETSNLTQSTAAFLRIVVLSIELVTS
jgi:hypothetical protein